MDFEKEEELEKSLALTPSTTLIKAGNDITNKIIDEDDPKKVDDLTQLFTLNQKKKNIARQNRLSNLLELIDDEVVMRFTSEPDTFDHDQLLRYMESTQRAVSAVSQSINETPTIQINNQEININSDSMGLNRESRARVLAAVQEILNNTNKDNTNKDIIDIEVNKHD